MKRGNNVHELLKARRKFLRLTQRSLAQKLGVEPSYVAMIETGRRKPSLKLVALIADSLGLDRQELLVITHPETKALLTTSRPPKKTTESWRRLIENHALHAHYQLTTCEREALEYLSSLGSALSAKDFLAILTLIRDSPEHM
jgi:transcriptional regulator with XRE-family HTH domain